MSNGIAHARLTMEQLRAKNGYPEPTEHEHSCPACGHPVACQAMTVLMAKHNARSEMTLAMHAEKRLLGVPSGRPRRKLVEWTQAELQDLVNKLGNINRARKQLGVGHATFVRALTGDTTRR